jgi:hypothetical protein
MSQISVTFVNDTGVAQNFAIYDTKASNPNNAIYTGLLQPNASVTLTVETGDDLNGKIRWVSDGSGQNYVDVWDGDTVNMSVVG